MLEEELNATKAKLAQDPYNRASHRELIVRLKSQLPQLWDELEAARTTYNMIFLPTTREIDDWIIDTKTYKPELIGNVYEAVIADYPSVRYWVDYLDYTEDWRRAVPVAKADFKNARKLWLKILSVADEPDHREILWDMISAPHEGLDESFSELSKWVLTNLKDDYQSEMTKANKVYAKTKKQLPYYEKFEFDLPAKWQEYLETLNRYRTLLDDLRVPFVRYILEQGYDFKMYLTYIYLLYLKPDNLELELLRFIRLFPDLPVPYAEYIRNCDLFADSNTTFSYAYDRALRLMTQVDYDQWKIVAQAILSHRKHLIDGGDKSELSSLLQDIFSFVEYAIDHNNDGFHSVEKLATTILYEIGESEKAYQILEAMVKQFPDQHSVWMFAINCFRIYRQPHVDSFFEQAVNIVDMDWPEGIIEAWLEHVQLQGNSQDYRNAVLKANAQMKKVSLYREEVKGAIEDRPSKKRDREEDDEDDEEEEKKELFSTKKQKNYENPDMKRLREWYMVKVSPITNEKLVKKLFADCGTIRNIVINENAAFVELTGERSVLAALTKDKKIVDDEVVTVERHQLSVVYVYNYPPRMSQQAIVDLFGQVGNIVDARFPNQTHEKQRRFCYIEYTSADSANEAVTKFNGYMLSENNREFKLGVAISDPSVKHRHTTYADCKVRVSNMPYEVSKSQIREFFSSKDVVIPQVNKNRRKDHHNDGIAIVIFEDPDQATNALSKDDTQFHGRNIHVTRVGRLYREFREPNTVGITGVNSSLSIDQIAAYFEEKGYNISKVEIFPANHAALVEFKSPAEAGKFTLAPALEEIQQLGETARVVSKADIDLLTKSVKRSAETKPKSMIPPSLQKRKR